MTASPSAAADAGVNDERTPLLAAEVAAPIEDSPAPPPPVSDDNDTNRDGDGDEKPLPRAQIMLLCLARLVEPVAFFSIFPYVNQMAQKNGHLAYSDTGFYSGLIESLFSATQAAVMILWGRAADRVGRKPILVASLAGVTAATAVFGLATTLWQMILFRCLAGVFAGTIVTIRTMIAEHSTARTQATAFSWFAFSGNLGIFLGPLVGGALADPVSQYPGLFAGIPFFVQFPYALSSFAVAGIGAVATVTSALFVKETLKKPSYASSHPASNGSSSPPEIPDSQLPKPPSVRSIVRSPGIAIVLYAYAHIMLLAFAYTAIVPLFWYTPVPLGGYGLTSLQISLLLSTAGASQAAWLLGVFPPLQHRVGTNGVLRLCATAYPFFFAMCPLGNVLLRFGVSLTVFWAVVVPLMVVGSGISMCFTAIQLALDEAAPSPAMLGTLNAVALSGVSAVRAVAPASFSSLFAIGAGTQWLSGYAIWVLMVALAAGFTVLSRYLPDYAELKRRRGGGGVV